MTRKGRRSEASPVVLDGIAGSPGLAIGRALVIDTRRPGVLRRHIKKHQADDELRRFDAAVAQALSGLKEAQDGTERRIAKAEASILEAYRLMLTDDFLRDEVDRRVRIDLLCAEWAVETATDDMAAQLKSGGDPYLAERSHDFEFIADLLQRALSGRARSVSLPDIQEPSIIVARDLSPADTATLAKDRVLAIVTEVGTRTSHTAILARALEIPAVVGVTGIVAKVGGDDRLVVDGYRGRVTISPTRAILNDASARAERHLAIARDRQAWRDRACATSCGVPVEVRANIELPAEAHIAMYEGAQGIGLYRTEFLYVDRSHPPTEDEQYGVYRQVLETVSPLPVTLRTFDIGGDKFVSSFHAPAEMNPALGLRAVRLALSRPELFLTQLRAMVRASAHGDLRIMVPMIASVDELTEVRKLLDRALAEVDEKGQARAAEVPLGIMVEVPSAAIMANELAVQAEFLSIGTNDLIQYALAVDRTNRSLAELGSPFDPAILRLIAQVVDAGKRRNRPVSVCGAMASNAIAAVLLIGMGLRSLSMEASAVAEVKEAVGRVSLAEAEAVYREVSGMVTAREIEKAVSAVFAPRFADLLETD
ncbi:MAG TPA: phosphoenolpyruvate--protein phosphotransferase [Polyangiaceae bacterium]|nr:phosphoenolpyruvate--protein phosphotransferase [Polyangiaceae bacterium]